MIPIEFKDQVARKYGYKDWESFTWDKSEHAKIMMDVLEESGLLYAQSKEPQWISVKERIPEPFKTVYVAGGVGLWTGSKWNTITGCEWPGQTIAWEVTHWMPLPEPPKPEFKP